MNKKGFSVVELLVVIALFGIIVAMVASVGPAVRQRARLNSTVNGLVSDLNLAKQMASAEGRFIAVEFSNDGTFYRLWKQKNIAVFSTTIDSTDWELIKKVDPLDGEAFFKTGKVTNFVFTTTGTVRLLSIVNTAPANVTLQIIIKESRYSPIVAFTKEIKVFPYGGIRIEE